MSIQDIRIAIQAHNIGLTGVKTAPVTMPNSLSSDELPCALVFAGPATWETLVHGHDGDMQRRSYTVRVFVKPVEQGIEGEGYEAAETLLQTMGKSYVADREIDSSVFWAWTISDGGVRGDLVFAGTAYVGFEITLTNQQWEVT